MSSVAPKFGTTLSLSEIEALIRRVVKEAVHEELTSILRLSPRMHQASNPDWRVLPDLLEAGRLHSRGHLQPPVP